MSKKYVGKRYVPKVMGEWNILTPYESLCVVTHDGASYTSKKDVPVGIDISNESYWVITGNYNAQVEIYRKEVQHSLIDIINNKDEIEKIKNKVDGVFINIEDYSHLATNGDWGEVLNYIVSNFGNNITVVCNYGKTYTIKTDINIINKLGFKLDGNGCVFQYTGDGNCIKISSTSWGDTRYCEIVNIEINAINTCNSNILIEKSFRNFVINKCKLTGKSKHGVLVSSCIKGVISQCEIHSDNMESGIKLYGNTTESLTTVTIQENYIWSTGVRASNVYKMLYGIDIHSAQSNRILNNVIEGVKYGVFCRHTDGGINSKSVKNKLVMNYFENMDISIMIENGGNSHHLYSNESINVNYGVVSNESQTKIISELPYKIKLDVESFHCSIIDPFVDSEEMIIDLGSNNTGIYGVNKVTGFHNMVKIMGDRKLHFYDGKSFVGGVEHDGGHIMFRSIGRIMCRPNNGTKDYDLQINYNGTTTNRPTGVPPATTYFDMTLGKPIWWTGSKWVDSTGTTI